MPALNRAVQYNHQGSLVAGIITDPGSGIGGVQQLIIFPPGEMPLFVTASEGRGWDEWQWPAYVPDIEIEVNDGTN